MMTVLDHGNGSHRSTLLAWGRSLFQEDGCVLAKTVVLDMGQTMSTSCDWAVLFITPAVRIHRL